MKQIKLFIFLLVGMTLINSCRKEDNPKLPDLIRVPTVLVNIDASSDKFISPVNPAAFKGVVNVDLLFADEKPQKVDLVVMRNGNANDVRVLQSGITTFPTKVEFTGQQLITLFGGQPITGGTKFDVGVNVTNQTGAVSSAFVSGANTFASGVITEIGNVKPGATTSVQYLMPCPFNADAYAGDFEVLQDDWNDYKKGTVIPVKKVSATEISFEYAVDPGTAKPIIMKINTADNSITVVRQEYGSYSGDRVFAESVPGSFSSVNPCDVSLSVRLKHSDPSGATVYGNATIKLKKK